MNHFNYIDRELYCEDVPITTIAKKTGTPFYLYSHATLTRHFQAFNNAFKGINKIVCFSAKSNTSLSVLKLLKNLGSGLDIVSGGELYCGLKAGFSPDKIVYSGVGKRVDEIDYALKTNILMFNIESLEELEFINQRAGFMGTRARIAIRVNPDVDPLTHPYISTGMKKNKFGIDIASAVKAYKLATRLENVEPIGVDCHIGSQITEIGPFKEALKSLNNLISALREIGIQVKYLDMGGGLGITYNNELPPDPDQYANAISASIKNQDIQLILEPGRVIVGNAGILVTSLLYKKHNQVKTFLVTDAGMNDLMRPALYEAFHNIIPVVQNKDAEPILADIVGPICESSDFLARDRTVPDVKQGDLLAVMSAGAYGYTMSSNYCSRLKLAEVMVKGDSFDIIRKRQTYDDLIAGESIPSFLVSEE